MFLRVVSTSASIGVVYLTYCSFALLVEAIQGHVGSPGNILRVEFGVTLILTSALLFIASIICWKSSKFPSNELSN